MITDSRQLPAAGPAAADLCVIGAGVAGIALARQLEGSGRRILLVEAGDLGFDAACQRLLEGQAVGDPYPPLRDTRLAALGGSTGVWAGFCRPLEVRDFEARSGSIGWPFGRSTLDACYRRAQAFLEVAPFDCDAAAASQPCCAPILQANPDVRNWIFQLSVLRPGVRYRPWLEASRSIELLLRAPVMRLYLDSSGCRVDHALVRTLNGRSFRIRAPVFVLAAGGIENARLLLLSGDSPERAPGNGRGLVGRYFTDHPFVDPGYLELTDGSLPLDHYFPHASAGTPPCLIRGALSLAPTVLERENMLNGALLFYPRYEAHDAFATREVKALLEACSKVRGRAVPGGAGAHLACALRAPQHVAIAMLRRVCVANRPAKRWRLRAMFETESRFENRVSLDTACDELGRPRARLEWRLGERDLCSMRRFMQLMNEAVRRAGLGRIVGDIGDDAAGWRAAAMGGKHHMGTTRMHPDPAQGVVDENARVHGTTNLFVAGSSVFASGGLANPTLTLVALAMRLADHLDDLHQRSSATG